MSYLQFHLLFVLPPILLLALGREKPFARLGRWAGLGVPVMSLVALAYTTPWDNYLIRQGVWVYGEGRVLGTVGYVPLEEYLFFVLQQSRFWAFALGAAFYAALLLAV